ncbi:MAG: chitobiase/beta-hexosaminidase C-terminal domain-containing protein [Lachnospiraceae bacterium]|nr:chitobiase/beta-hexosaminidase C-terminal domain-containing protein [Lachnospiraceae bacterium]
MKCKYCGNEMPEGAIYCEHCGKPVQMVPDYNAFDDEVLPSLVSDEAANRKNNVNSLVSSAGTSEGDTSAANKASAPAKPAKKRTMVLSCIAIAVLAVILFASYYVNTPGYQKGAGDKAYAAADYSAAASHYLNALSSHDTDAALLAALGDCYVELGNTEEAEKYYQQALTNDKQNERAFAGLCSLYAAAENYDGLSSLKASAVTNAQQKAIDSAYISEITFSEDEGEYDDDQEISLSSPEGYPIYYTIDGTDPLPETATLYDGQPIAIGEGETVISARAITEAGSKGPVTQKKYTVNYAAPDYVTVTPDGGTFYAPTQVMICYPEDAKAAIYYTWDGSNPTAASSRYSGPMEIPEGNNILSVIVIDRHGLSSPVYRGNFVFLPDGIASGEGE